MTVTTIRELEVATVAMLVVGALVALAVLLRVRLAADSPDDRAIVVGAGLTVLFSVLFAWGIGIIASRLMFHAVPALFVIGGWLAARVTAGSRPASRLVGPALPGAGRGRDGGGHRRPGPVLLESLGVRVSRHLRTTGRGGTSSSTFEVHPCPVVQPRGYEPCVL